MTADVVIRAEGLGKKYAIGRRAERERYVALRDVLARGARNAWRKAADLARGRAVLGGDRVEEFWALKDVSFEVGHGEVLGIVGRNGAGKSTLLKILSRITEPSEGRVAIRGRVASLLEVGTGFHPELTGRENIYLNGTILGMARSEISAKFDQIVAFAGVEKFLDTPVKRYSSGMYVRLAFSVAAHLEPEILVVDEVLAVGDAAFQNKCLGRLGDVAQEGRTVLFVSHNMAALRRLCARGLLLESGRVKVVGDIDRVVDSYISDATGPSESGKLPFRDKRVAIESVTTEQRGGDLLIHISARTDRAPPRIGIGIHIKDELGQLLAGLAPFKTQLVKENVGKQWRTILVLPDFFCLFTEGTLLFDLWLSEPGVEHLDFVERAAVVRIPSNDRFQTGHSLKQGEDGYFALSAKLQSDIDVA